MNTLRDIFDRIPMMQHAVGRLVQWGNATATGDTAIDAQHRVILDLIEEIDELRTDCASIAEFRRVAGKTRRMLKAHFLCEERMLVAVGYPELSAHAAQHQDILEDLALIQKYMNSDDDVPAVSAGLRLSNFILAVTLGHSIDADGDYCRYIMDETSKLSTGCA